MAHKTTRERRSIRQRRADRIRPVRRRMVEVDADELRQLRLAAARAPLTEAMVSLDRQLLESVDRVLQSTGSSVADYLELQLIKFGRNKAIHGLEDRLTFGQYEGLVVQHVCETDLSYMHWLVIEQGSKKFKSEVADYIRQLANQEAGYL